MSTALQRTPPNWITFPRELRDAIPEAEPSLGRVLQLAHADVVPTNTAWTGHRVAVKLTACETGNLTGVFDVVVSLNIDAARALADLLQSAADKASTRQ
jgi:hypothetical protein